MHVQCMAYVQCVSLLILFVHLTGLTRHLSHEEEATSEVVVAEMNIKMTVQTASCVFV